MSAADRRRLHVPRRSVRPILRQALDQLSPEEIRAYQLHLIEVRGPEKPGRSRLGRRFWPWATHCRHFRCPWTKASVCGWTWKRRTARPVDECGCPTSDVSQDASPTLPHAGWVWRFGGYCHAKSWPMYSYSSWFRGAKKSASSCLVSASICPGGPAFLTGSSTGS